MIVRLLGDGTSFQNMLQVAQSTSQQVAAVVGNAAAKISSLGSSLKSFGQTAIGALGFFGASASLTSAFDKFSQLEKGMLRLNTVVEANGRIASEVVPDYLQFADAMAKVTMTTKGATLNMLQQAESFGLSGDQAKAAVKNAVALAGALGGEADAYLRITVSLAQGNTALLRRLPGLRGIKNESELVARAQDLMVRGFKVAEAETQLTSNQIEKLKKSLAGVTADIGGMVAPAVAVVVGWLQQAVNWFKALDADTRKITTTMIALFAVATNFGTLTKLLAPLIALFRILASPAGAVFAGLGLAIGKLVKDAGGLSVVWDNIVVVARDAWEQVKDAILGFIEWARPVWIEIRDGAVGIWNLVVFAAKNAGGALEMVWEGLVAGWQMVAEAVTPLIDQLTELALIGYAWARDFISANKEGILTIVSLAGAVLATIAAFKLLAAIIGLVQAVLITLRVQQILTTLALTAWSAMVAVAKGAMFLWNTAMLIGQGITAAFTTTIVLSSAAWAVWSGITLVVKGVIWLVNAALTVMNVLLAPATILGAAAAFAILVPLAITLGSAVYGVYAAGVELFTVLGQLPATAGPIAHIGGLFQEWGGILSNIWEALKTDSDLAWRLMAAGGKLAVEQIRDLWPPLWDFIRAGFDALSEIVSLKFVAAFKGAIVTTLSELAGIGGTVGKVFAAMQLEITGLGKVLTDNSAPAIEAAGKRLEEALRKFKVVERDETKTAREAVKAIQNELEEADFWRWIEELEMGPEDRAVAEAKKNALAVGTGIGQSIKQGIGKENLQGILVGTAEDLRQIAAYTDMIRGGGTAGASVSGAIGEAEKRMTPVERETARQAREDSQMQIKILGEIRDILRERQGPGEVIFLDDADLVE